MSDFLLKQQDLVLALEDIALRYDFERAKEKFGFTELDLVWQGLCGLLRKVDDNLDAWKDSWIYWPKYSGEEYYPVYAGWQPESCPTGEDEYRQARRLHTMMNGSKGRHRRDLALWLSMSLGDRLRRPRLHGGVSPLLVTSLLLPFSDTRPDSLQKFCYGILMNGVFFKMGSYHAWRFLGGEGYEDKLWHFITLDSLCEMGRIRSVWVDDKINAYYTIIPESFLLPDCVEVG